MNKLKYIKPTIEVVDIKGSISILAGSNPSSNPDLMMIMQVLVQMIILFPVLKKTTQAVFGINAPILLVV